MTRSILPLALLSLACDAPRAPLDAGSDAGAPVLADVRYALRCAEDGCARVDVDVYGAAPEVLATCARTESGLVDFAAAPLGGPLLRVDAANGAACMVSLEVDGTTYSARCRVLGSPDDTPCVIGDLRFGAGEVSGLLFCDSLAAEDGSTRMLTAMGPAPSAPALPAPFHFVGCAP